MKHILPVPTWCIETQSYAEHEARARQMGCCSKPATGCKRYYYGGLDLAPPWPRANEEISITASAAGVCAIQDQGVGGYGLHVRLTTDDGELIIYGHLSRASVRGGQRVQAGDQIGWMGNTGNSTGKHLHWEIRVNGIPVDPRSKMGAAEPVEPPAPSNPSKPIILPEFPKLPKARLLTDTLNIRSSPEVATGNLVGRLVAPVVMDVIQAVQKRGDTWLRIGYNQWCALEYQGERYMEFVD